MYYVLGGQVRFSAGEKRLDAPAGSFVFIPRGTPHCFRNTGDEPAHLLVMFSPSGMERFFEGMATFPDGPVDQAAYRALAASAGMDVVGPPMGPDDETDRRIGYVGVGQGDADPPKRSD
jgi:hypothetical protein